MSTERVASAEEASDGRWWLCILGVDGCGHMRLFRDQDRLRAYSARRGIRIVSGEKYESARDEVLERRRREEADTLASA